MAPAWKKKKKKFKLEGSTIREMNARLAPFRLIPASRALWLLCLLLPACALPGAGSGQPNPGQPSSLIYRPPDVTPRPTPTATPRATELPELVTPTGDPLATQASACTSQLNFVEDLSIPDGSRVAAGEQIDKRWLVENPGSCNWDEGYRLRLVAGHDLDAPAEQALYPARAGSRATIRILYTAPNEPGAYQSAWQAFDPQDQPFGDPIYIQIVVEISGD
jgi:hypothetical protein